MLHVHQRRSAIAKLLPKESMGAEIGVFCGEFSQVLAKATMPRRLYLIDPWWTSLGEVFPWRPELSTRTAHAMTVERMKWWIEREIAIVQVRRSQEALVEMNDGHLDWAYLDSSHEFHQTLEELELLKRKVKPEGVICGHDFNTRKHPGVFRAISRFLRRHKRYRLSYLDNHAQWAIRRME